MCENIQLAQSKKRHYFSQDCVAIKGKVIGKNETTERNGELIVRNKCKQFERKIRMLHFRNTGNEFQISFLSNEIERFANDAFKIVFTLNNPSFAFHLFPFCNKKIVHALDVIESLFTLRFLLEFKWKFM